MSIIKIKGKIFTEPEGGSISSPSGFCNEGEIEAFLSSLGFKVRILGCGMWRRTESLWETDFEVTNQDVRPKLTL